MKIAVNKPGLFFVGILTYELDKMTMSSGAASRSRCSIRWYGGRHIAITHRVFGHV